MGSWWRGLSGAAKFRLYTRVTLQGAVISVVIAISISGGGLWAAAGIAVSGLATIVALEAQPELATWPSPRQRRWAITLADVVLAGAWAASAVVAQRSTVDATIDEARVVGLGTAMLATLGIFSFSRHRWWMLGVLSVVTGVALGSPAGSEVRVAAASAALGVFVISTTMLTLWGLRIVADVERAKNLEADLQLAEERLRFARDLHDVVGRSFSAIAVKSELAATLSRSGDPERASAEMTEVKALAVESMEEMRTLVRGYRDIDLDSEVAGARSLLSASGCDLTVEGDPARVPAELHEVAAWVVREGTTNIVRHSSASTATLALGAAGMTLRNDGASGRPGERSGLLGLAERLAAHGAALDIVTSGDTFTLEVTWETR